MKRILIIDMNPEAGQLFGRIAEGLGFEAMILDDPENFEAEYQRFEPKLVVLDLQIPGIDAVAILRYLEETRSEAALIFTTGVHRRSAESAERLASSMGLTVAAVLTKPVDPAALKDRLQRIDPARLPDAKRDIRISESGLAGAIAGDELLLAYQPIVSLVTGEAIGVEALVRWMHPEFGLIPPDDFIPLAEETGLISPLTYWVLTRAATEMSEMRHGARAIDVSINLSPRLLEDLDLPNRVSQLLGELNFPHDRLMLEVTESGAMEDPNRSMDILVRLCLKNIRLSIDDFGTGYSSLLQLYRLPFCEIKIDRYFVQKALTSDEAAAVVKSTVGLGQNLGLRVVAEGIEDEETRNHMAALGCNAAQGYFFCEPVSAEGLSAWLSDSGAQGPGPAVRVTAGGGSRGL